MFKENEEDAEEIAEIERLEERFVSHPTLALEQSNNVVSSMGRKAKKNLGRAIGLIYDYSDEVYNKIQAKEEVIDRYEDKLGTYLVKISGEELTSEGSRDISRILHTIGDFERIGDHAVNISHTAREIAEKKLKFSQQAENELNTVTSAVSKIVELAITAFDNNDVAVAKHVEPLEQVIDNLCDDIKMRHVKRLQKGECTLDHGFAFNDLLTNFERISDHCSNIAVAIIELQHDVFNTHKYLHNIKDKVNEQYVSDFDTYANLYALD